jgi:hypothetical protein
LNTFIIRAAQKTYMKCPKFRSKNSIGKVPFSIIWRSRGIKSLVSVPKSMKCNTIFFVESGIMDLVGHVCQESRRKTLRGITIHLDNAGPRNSRKSEAALTATRAPRISVPACSPNLSPSDFFLFGMLKERTLGTSYISPDELISAMSDLIASLSKDQLVSVFKNWAKGLNWVIKHRGGRPPAS